MPRSLSNLIRAIDELLDANLQMRENLVHQHDVLNAARTALLAGTSVTEVLRGTPSAEERAESDRLVRNFYAKRAAVRDGVMRAAMTEGMPINDIARAFNIHHEEVASRALQVSDSPPSRE
jgi:hypothetical protein